LSYVQFVLDIGRNCPDFILRQDMYWRPQNSSPTLNKTVAKQPYQL